MKTYKGKPVKYLKLKDEPESGISLISLVTQPAIEIDFTFLSTEEHFELKTDDKMIVAGYCLIPDKMIYRSSLDYYVSFTKESIEEIYKKLFKNLQNTKIFNLQHSNVMVDAYLLGSELVQDENYTKAKYYGFKGIKGAIFIECKIEDPYIWENYIKKNKVKGFSIEALLSISDSKFEKEEMSNLLMELNEYEFRSLFSRKISIDFEILKTPNGIDYVRDLIRKGNEVFVISNRFNRINMLNITRRLGIPDKNVFADGSDTAKINTIRSLKVDRHLDRDQKIIDTLYPYSKKY